MSLVSGFRRRFAVGSPLTLSEQLEAVESGDNDPSVWVSGGVGRGWDELKRAIRLATLVSNWLSMDEVVLEV